MASPGNRNGDKGRDRDAEQTLWKSLSSKLSSFQETSRKEKNSFSNFVNRNHVNKLTVLKLFVVDNIYLWLSKPSTYFKFIKLAFWKLVVVDHFTRWQLTWDHFLCLGRTILVSNCILCSICFEFCMPVILDFVFHIQNVYNFLATLVTLVCRSRSLGVALRLGSLLRQKKELNGLSIPYLVNTK